MKKRCKKCGAILEENRIIFAFGRFDYCSEDCMPQQIEPYGILDELNEIIKVRAWVWYLHVALASSTLFRIFMFFYHLIIK